MDQKPDYRRRRIGVAFAALALLAVADHDRPGIGAISIDFDRDAPIRIAAAPALDVMAQALVYAAEQLRR